MSTEAIQVDIVSRSYPVAKAILRTKTVEIKREGKAGVNLGNGRHNRTNISRFTSKSRMRLAFAVLETEVTFQSLLTLTFGKNWPKDGKVTKKMLNRFLTWLKTKADVEYLWFLEWQVRGAPHLHILLTWPHCDKMHNDIANNWARSNQKEMGLDNYTQSLLARQHSRPSVWEDVRSQDGAKKYVTKYALKTKQKKVPKQYQNVGRFWGASQKVKRAIPDGIEIDISEEELRQWLADRDQVSANWIGLPSIVFLR